MIKIANSTGWSNHRCQKVLVHTNHTVVLFNLWDWTYDFCARRYCVKFHQTFGDWVIYRDSKQLSSYEGKCSVAKSYWRNCTFWPESGLFKGKLDAVGEFRTQRMPRIWFQLYSATVDEFFEVRGVKSSLWMIFSLCGRLITCWQLWQMSRDEMGMSFLHCVKRFLHCVKSVFALCEECFCTVWRGFAYFVSGLERASWPSGVSSLFQNNLQYPINILKTGLSDLHARNFKTQSYSLASAKLWPRNKG